MRFIGKGMLFLTVVAAVNGCGTKESDKSGSVSAKFRSTGLKSVALTSEEPQISTLKTMATMTANIVELEYYKVPVRRINLVAGFDGSKYSSASPNIYSCDSSKSDDECLVDLSKSILVDNLLASSSTSELSVSGDATYDGAAIEFCKDDHTSSDTYKIRVKGSVVINGTLYYTSASQGLSSTLTAAEEAQLPVTCAGKSTPFLSSVTVGPDKSVSLVIYADPNGNVFGTNSSTLANSNCIGSGTYALCGSLPSIFLSSDTATPTIERYALTVTTTKSGSAYRNLMLKLLINSSDAPIGATLQEHYRNDTAEKSLHTALIDLNQVTKNADSTYDLTYFSQKVIQNFKRGSDSGNKILAIADAELTFNQSKFD